MEACHPSGANPLKTVANVTARPRGCNPGLRLLEAARDLERDVGGWVCGSASWELGISGGSTR